MAAIFSAQVGAQTTVIEANARVGRKLLLTGGGRCNFTHLAAAQEIARAFGAKGRFLNYSLHKFPPESVRQFFQKCGLKSKLEDDGCVFPATNRAGDVRDVLLTEAKRLGVRFVFSKKVESVTRQREYFVISNASQKILAEKIIIATGGMSYHETGSTGDGYKFAQCFGHAIIQPRASLVPLVTLESWPSELAGTSLDNVKISVVSGKKKNVVTGSMLFTHDGIGGPAALELSRFVTDFLPNDKNPVKISINLVSNVSEAEFERIILRQISEHPKKTVANILAEIVPRRVSQALCRQLNFPENLYAGQLSKDLRKKLLHFLKAMPLSIVRTRPIKEAMVTRGGVSITEIEYRTMESKICPGLFFAGEVLDVDGPCGGYNLQMCWSTGALAGISAAQRKQ
jgi:predicted Rossmann fold flavoprotein